MTSSGSGVGTDLTYQWQRKTPSGAWEDIGGATGDSYTIEAADAGYQFRVVVREASYDGVLNSAPTGAVVSKASESTITQPSPPPYYTVTYKLDANSTTTDPTTEQVKENDKPAHVPAVIARLGYAFLGWSMDDGQTLVDPASGAITGDTVFEAVTLPKEQHFAFMNGYPDGSFKPDGSITRAEAAAIVARIIDGNMDIGTYASSFSDVGAGKWYTDYIGYVELLGIMSGYDDGTFRPDQPISREELAKVIALTAEYMGIISDVATGTPTFGDTDQITGWALNYIYTAQINGWMTGVGNNMVEPLRDVTRAEVCKMVDQMLGRGINAEGLGGNGFTVFNDMPGSNEWSYYYIIEASNDHSCVNFNGQEYWVN